MMRARNGYSSNFGCGVSGEISGPMVGGLIPRSTFMRTSGLLNFSKTSGGSSITRRRHGLDPNACAISRSWCKNAYLKDIRIFTLARVAARGPVAEV
jgi:hypothetical protein